MRINVVTVSSGWILQKIAERIVAASPEGVEMILSHSPKNDVDSNFYVDIQNCYGGKSKAIDIGFFTHLDEDSPNHLLQNKHWLTCDYIIHMAKRYFEVFKNYYPENQMMVIKPGEVTSNFELKKIKLGVIQRGGYPGKGFYFMQKLCEHEIVKNFEFLFVGKDWDRVIELYKNRGIKCYIADEKYENYPKAYDFMDYMLIPSLWEGGPMSIIEAYAKGVPIISSDVGFVNEFDVEYLFKPGNDVELANILTKIYSKLIERRNKVTHIKYNFFAERLVEITKNLLNKKS
jgi:glycosyltransferase involved in cell wall biosynthesis